MAIPLRLPWLGTQAADRGVVFDYGQASENLTRFLALKKFACLSVWIALWSLSICQHCYCSGSVCASTPRAALARWRTIAHTR